MGSSRNWHAMTRVIFLVTWQQPTKMDTFLDNSHRNCHSKLVKWRRLGVNLVNVHGHPVLLQRSKLWHRTTHHLSTHPCTASRLRRTEVKHPLHSVAVIWVRRCWPWILLRPCGCRVNCHCWVESLETQCLGPWVFAMLQSISHGRKIENMDPYRNPYGSPTIHENPEQDEKLFVH